MPRYLRPPVLVFLFLSSLACLPSKNIVRIPGQDEFHELYKLDYFAEPPQYKRVAPNWKCVRYLSECLGSSPLGAEIAWRSSEKASIEFWRIDSHDYVDSYTSVFDENHPSARILTRSCKVFHYSLQTSDPTIIDALDSSWEQLSKLTYYHQFGVDGCWFLLETYDANGLRRRCSLSNPDQPQFGADIIHILANVVDFAQKSAMSWETYDSFHGYRLDENGELISHETKDILCDIQDALAEAVMNEPQVQRYEGPPCDEEAAKKAKNADEMTRALEGCYTVKQPVDKKQWGKE